MVAVKSLLHSSADILSVAVLREFFILTDMFHQRYN